MLHFPCKIALPHLQATSSLTQRLGPKRPEHARVQGGPMQLKCGGGREGGGYIEKAGPRVETTSSTLLSDCLLCVLSQVQWWERCSSNVEEVGPRWCDDGACVRVISAGGRPAQNIVTARLDRRRRKGKIYVYFLSFRIWNRRRLSDV